MKGRKIVENVVSDLIPYFDIGENDEKQTRVAVVSSETKYGKKNNIFLRPKRKYERRPCFKYNTSSKIFQQIG